MRWITVLSLLLVGLVCLSVAQVSYDDCCLRYVNKLARRVQRNAVSFRIQETDGGCNIRAVIFTMKKGRVYCTDPNEKWVQELMDYVRKRPRKHGRRQFKG